MQAPRVPRALARPPNPAPGPIFLPGMIAMQTRVSGQTDGSTRRGLADDTVAVSWLEDMGVVTIDEDGSWNLTALGQAAMARFNSRYQGAEPAH